MTAKPVDREEFETAQLPPEFDYLVCPTCGSDDISRRHVEPPSYPLEANWLECNNCGQTSFPE